MVRPVRASAKRALVKFQAGFGTETVYSDGNASDSSQEHSSEEELSSAESEPCSDTETDDIRRPVTGGGDCQQGPHW